MIPFASAFCLIIGNAVPLAGVFFFGWDVRGILILYWFENAIVGLFVVIKMLFAENRSSWTVFDKFFCVPFFCVHYSGFCLVHAYILAGMLGYGPQLRGSFGGLLGPMAVLWLNRPSPFVWIAAGLFVSQAAAFAETYILGSERECTVDELMKQPYPRLVVLHITIIAGGFMFVMYDSPVTLLAVLVVVKTLMELFLARKRRIARVTTAAPAIRWIAQDKGDALEDALGRVKEEMRAQHAVDD